MRYNNKALLIYNIFVEIDIIYERAYAKNLKRKHSTNITPNLIMYKGKYIVDISSSFSEPPLCVSHECNVS